MKEWTYGIGQFGKAAGKFDALYLLSVAFSLSNMGHAILWILDSSRDSNL